MSFPLPCRGGGKTVVHVHGNREAGGEFSTYAVHEKTFDDGNQLGLIVFQNGPVKEFGVNGMTEEDLINICIHRLTCFQTGPYACEENDEAIKALKTARYYLNHRREQRQMRGVEGTSQV